MENKVESRLVGFVRGGVYNKDTKKFEIKRLSLGDKIALGLSFSTTKKNKDGSRVYGSEIPVLMWINDKSEFTKVEEAIKELITLEGYFQANNYEKDGKEIKGLQFVTDISKMNIKASASGKASAPEPTEEW